MASSGRSKSSLSHLLEQIPASVPDAELDDYIANLILRQSKQRSEQYDRKGIAAYLDEQPGPSNRSRAASTNKNFLASVIRSVEGHNSALIRQQTAEAQSIVRDQRKRKSSDTLSQPPAPHPPGSGSPEIQREHRRKSRSAKADHMYESKMDKYFRKDYDPALDINVDDLTDGATGLIAADDEQSSAPWDRMLTVLTNENGADSDKKAKQQRKEERDRIRALRTARRESRTKRHESDRSRSPSPHRHKRDAKSRHSPRLERNHGDNTRKRRAFKSEEQIPKATPTPKVREWDLGKNLSF